MNFYIDARALQLPYWRGQQFYIFYILDQMIQAGSEHTFHLHFGWDDWNPRIDALLVYPNVVRHDHRGKYWAHASVPLEMIRTRSRVYYRMFNEDQRLYTPIPGKVSALVLDNGKHMAPSMYGGHDPETLRQYTRSYIHRFDMIVTISQTMKNELVELFDLPPEKLLVAPCGFTIPEQSDAEDARPEKLPDPCRYFLMVNPGGPNKNWQLALAGFKHYIQTNAQDPETRLVMVGNLGNQTEFIRKAVQAEPDLEKRIDFLGYVSDSELHYLYKHARLSLFVSHYEGFGIPILEAMTFQLPNILSDIPIFREVAGEAAVYVPLDDPEALASAMQKLDNDEPLRQKLISQGANRIGAYSWRESAHATLSALQKLAEQ